MGTALPIPVNGGEGQGQRQGFDSLDPGIARDRVVLMVNVIVTDMAVEVAIRAIIVSAVAIIGTVGIVIVGRDMNMGHKEWEKRLCRFV